MNLFTERGKYKGRKGGKLFTERGSLKEERGRNCILKGRSIKGKGNFTVS